MPGIIVHTLLATRVLGRWQRDATTAPFRADEPSLRAAFLSGCMGPDMGMYPGGSLLFSDLAHYVRSGELTRALLQCAQSDAERAFAWGWATHVLADALIHPLVNIAAGDARGRGALTYAEDPWAHLAVEVGADGCAFARWRELTIPPQQRLPDSVAHFVERAYRAVYGPAISAEQVRASMLGWVRWHGFAIATAGAASAKLYGRSRGRHGFHGFSRIVTKFGTGMFSRGSRMHALTHPLAPSARAEALIERAVDEFPDQFRELERTELASLPDYNLDTGSAEQPDPYPLTASTLARLNEAKTSNPQLLR